jgi:Ca2+-binding EF-hand superfamily protein
MSRKQEVKDVFSKLTFDEKETLRNIYEKVDSDGNGELSKDEVGKN